MLPSQNLISLINIKKEIPDTDDICDDLSNSSILINHQTDHLKNIKIEPASIIQSLNYSGNEIFSKLSTTEISNIKYSNEINSNLNSRLIIKQESIDIKTEIYIESDSTTIKPDLETSLISFKEESYDQLADFENYSFNQHLSESKISYCDIREKGFSTEQKMKLHRSEVHTTIKKHIVKCTRCEKYFNTKQNLKRHERTVHLKIRDWKCTQCGKSYTTKLILQQHERTVHLKISEWKCTLCQKLFITKHNLTLHERTVHLKIRDWKCTQCEKSYSTKDYLKNHERSVHLGVKDWKCTFCNKSFGFKQNLKKHEKIAHLKI